MIFYSQDASVLLETDVEDTSFRHLAIMGDNNITFHFSLAEHVELPVGTYCHFGMRIYTLERPEAFTMKHSRNFEYTVVMECEEAKAKKYKFRNSVDGRLKFTLTAKPKEHLQMFIDNMNRRDTGWSVGDCIESTEIMISYNHNFCYEALSAMSTEMKTEFEFDNKRVSLKKVEYEKSNPLPLAYGCGNGFRSNIGRSNSGDRPPVEILFVQGGNENIDRSKYGNAELLLPKGQTIMFDGEFFETDNQFTPTHARKYIVDDKGLSVRRSDRQLQTQAEDSLDASDIYPKREGVVTEVVAVNTEKNFYDIIDSSIPDTLNFNDCLIDGNKLTIIFQTGMLVARKFEVTYFNKVVDGKSAKRFELVPVEEDGLTLPCGNFVPVIGDKYAVFNCSLPNSYICDNETKTGAEWDMFKTAVKYMYEKEEMKYTFKGELDGIWAKKNWETIGEKIKLGGYIDFKDNQFQKESVLVRIIGIKEYINNMHSPELELSNETVTTGFAATINELKGNEVIVDELHSDGIQFTKRRFRDAKETMSSLEQALLDNFSNSINPITVQTMSMLIGDESLQFRFVSNKTNPVAVPHEMWYSNSTKQLIVAAGIIQHLTLDIGSLSSSHSATEYKYWDVPEYISGIIEDGTKIFYLYAKVSKTNQTGNFLLSETAIGMEDVASYYHLLVGVLNREYNGDRSFAILYGFTEILPGRITTDRIVSGSGQSYFDMENNAMKLSDVLDFNSQGDGKLRLKGTIVQNQGGTESTIGCYRGEYNSSYTYYNGDEVTYSGSTYRYIYDTPILNIAPTNTTYWSVLASGGDAGVDGTSLYVEEQYSADGGINGWHDDFQSTDYYKRYRTVAVDGKYTIYGKWSDGVRCRKDGEDGYTPQKGVDYYDGKDGSFVSFIYKLSDNTLTPTGGAYNGTTETIPTGWNDNPIYSSTVRTQVSTTRYMQKSDGTWANSGWSASVQYLGQDGSDGTKEEKVYKRTEMNLAPDKPSTSQIDDYVPDGWTDDPQGVSTEYPFEWVAIRTKENNVWSAFTTPVIWTTYMQQSNPNLLSQTEFESWEKTNKWEKSKYTAKSGYTFNIGDKPSLAEETGYIYLYIAAESAPATPTTSNYVSSGWSTGKVSPSVAKPYVYYTRRATSGTIFSSSKLCLTLLATSNGWIMDGAQGHKAFYNVNGYTTDKVEYMSMLKQNVNDVLEPATWYTLSFFSKGNGVEVIVNCIDSSAGAYIDSEYTNIGTDGWATFVLENNWMKHTFVFKTSLDIANASLEFRLIYETAYICMPKLERGRMITPYIPKTTDLYVPYYEYRYAKSGSTTTPPSLVVTDTEPAGWATAQPKAGILEYIWQTVSEKNSDGTLLTNWATPVRITPKDGEDGTDGQNGNSPVLVYRGVYDNAKTYYGLSQRLDAVKYNDMYYVARTDAGNFSGVAPTDTSRWNSFGASFESVATGLLLSQLAYVGNLIVNRISTGTDDSLPRLLANSNEIGFYKNKSNESSTGNAMVRLGIEVGYMTTNGTSKPGISVRDKDGDGSYSEMTSEGIFTNGSNINALSAASGISSCISIAALLQHRVAGGQYSNSLNAAIYGNDQTSDSDAAYSEGYGGYFNKLKANGLYVGCRRISNSTTLNQTDVFISCYNSSDITVTLPSNPYAGQMLMIRRNNTAAVTANGNGKLIINANTVSSISIGEGQGDIGLFVYDGQYWTYNYIVRKP